MHKFYKQLFNEIGKDKELLKELVSDFISIYEEHIEELSNGIENGSYDDIAFIAHKLKGSSMNFNMPEFTKAAEELENIGRGQLDKNMSKPFGIMREQFNLFNAAEKEL